MPQDKSIVVPGSWRAACRRWQWVERSHAWDDFIIDRTVEANYNALVTGYAQKARRIFLLNELLSSVVKRLNGEAGVMTHEQANFWHARAQSLMRDIRDEVATLDAQWEKGVLRKQAREDYISQATPEQMDELVRLVQEAQRPIEQ